MDFEDFSWVFKLKEQGHHYTHKGKNLIDSFIGQMNNNRLSTLGGLPREDREFLISQAKIILQGPSRYIFINNEIINKNITAPIC